MHRAAQVGDFLGALADQHQHRVGVVGGHRSRDGLQHHGLAGFRRRHDEAAALADGATTRSMIRPVADPEEQALSSRRSRWGSASATSGRSAASFRSLPLTALTVASTGYLSSRSLGRASPVPATRHLPAGLPGWNYGGAVHGAPCAARTAGPEPGTGTRRPRAALITGPAQEGPAAVIAGRTLAARGFPGPGRAARWRYGPGQSRGTSLARRALLLSCSAAGPRSGEGW